MRGVFYIDLITSSEAKLILNQSGVSQRKLAEKTGVNYSYISEWLHNKRILELESLIKMTSYFEKVRAIV